MAKLKAEAEAKRLNALELSEAADAETMIPYNLAGSTIDCHHFLHHGGGTGREFPKELLNPEHANWSKWYTNQQCGNGLAGWVHIKFRKPLVMNGVGLTSANDVQTRDPQDFRLYAKLAIPGDGAVLEADLNEYQKDLVKDFQLMKTVKGETFESRYENKKYLFEKRNVVVSEIMLVIDSIVNKEGDGP